MFDGFSILYGDIHNHNAMGYGVGSMERSIDIARTHLDFFAFTGHSSWHDMAPMEGGRESHWIEGFRRLERGWPEVQRLIADANRDDAFTAFLGFEWHSSRFGDHCVVFPEDRRPLAFPGDIAGLRAFCAAERALMIPHHLAYPTGRRGVNWAVFDPARTPVVEIFSEHGNSEHDRGPFAFFNHSMGGRRTANTVRHALDRGLRFGFVASSDSHSGFPGAYGEGLMAALVRGHDRASILEAIAARRTYALTGDRIALGFAVEGVEMGGEVTSDGAVEVAFDVEGRDELDAVEIVHNGEIVHRAFPRAAVPLAEAVGAPFQLRLEWGWGPWGDLALDRVCDWEFDIAVEGGALRKVFPCLQSGPFDERRRHHFRRIGENEIRVTSYTSRRGAYRLDPNQSAVLEMTGGPDTRIVLRLRKPAADTAVTTVAALCAGSVDGFTGPFPAEAWQWHRLLPRAASALSGACTLPAAESGYVYLRVRQQNGHMAWASPVFLDRRRG